MARPRHIPGAGPELSALDPDWQCEFESLAFTAEALLAHPEPDDQELGRLARRVASVLADWEEIDGGGRGLRRAAIYAAARVRAADVALDVAIGAFANDVLRVVSDDRGSDLYQRFFPEPHEDVIELGVDAALPAVMAITLALSADEAVSNDFGKHADDLRASMQLAHTALAERADVLADFGRHLARVEAWKESARATRRNLRRAIGALAEGRGLPPRWAAAFFPAPSTDD